MNEKMPSKGTRRTQGSPTHWAHIALGVAHHGRVLKGNNSNSEIRRMRGTTA